uniref:Uncharacterized protein n=1 Tax=Avena sativa TaxID=4498 RepID=A0ACD5TU12_AVESA
MAGVQMQRAVAAAAALLLACSLARTATAWVSAHNITAFLNGHPAYKLYNKYLTETRVCDEINTRAAVTCLVLTDDAMATLVSDAGAELGAIKNALRLHSLLDYWDTKKLRALPAGDTLTDTFYQAAGNARSDHVGGVKMAKLDGGGFGFKAAASNADNYDATMTKALKQTPYDFAVLEISAPIEFDGLFDLPDVANLTKLLEKAGCKRFAALVAGTPGVLAAYQGAMEKGLTLFAPNDDAFMAKGAPDVAKMSRADLLALLLYHAVPSYIPRASLKLLKSAARPLRTLASTASGQYNMSVVARGDDVSLNTGVRKCRLTDTVLDDTPVCMFTVDKLLLPVELFASAPAEAPEPASAPAPADAAALSSPPAPPPADEEDSAEPADHKHKDLKASSATALRSIVALATAGCYLLLVL